MASFFVVLGTGEKKLVSSEKSLLRIGRLAESEIPIDEPVVSRNHAEIFRSDDRYYVRDTGSRNGTFIDGKRLFKEAALSPGDIIGVGNARIIYEPSESLYFLKDKEVAQPTSSISLSAPPPRQAMAPILLLETVAAIAREIVQTKPLEGVLDSILRVCVEKMGAEKAVMLLIDKDGALLPRACYLKSESGEACSVSRSIVQKAIHENKAILIKDVAGDENLRKSDSIIGLRIRSAICTPLWNGEKTIGALYVDTTDPGSQFGETDLFFFSSLSGMIAEKIENSMLGEIAKEKQRLDTELEIARDIQNNLFPKEIPTIPGYDISCFTRPSLQVGGDYFDVIPVGTSLGIAIADVSGKGIGAAMLMSNLQAVLRSKAASVRSPGQILGQMNLDLVDRVGRGRFISFFYTVLEPEKGLLIYSNAGHNPPLVFDVSGKITPMDVSGVPLGIFTGVAYPEFEQAISPGSVLVLYSDGITECMNAADEQFGEARLNQVLADTAPGTAEAIAQAIVMAADTFRGEEPTSDDMTLVVLKRLAV